MRTFKSKKSAAKAVDLKTFRVDSQVYQTNLTKKFINRPVWEEPDPGEIYSYIPGMVIDIIAKEGERLTAGASLLRFEAMKMECTLTMPYDGVVKKINIKVGDRFPKNQILVEIGDVELQ